jgi:hypothetical protein
MMTLSFRVLVPDAFWSIPVGSILFPPLSKGRLTSHAVDATVPGRLGCFACGTAWDPAWTLQYKDWALATKCS